MEHQLSHLALYNLCLLVLLFIPRTEAKLNEDETTAAKFLERAEEEMRKAMEKMRYVEWDYLTNITNDTTNRKLEEQVLLSRWQECGIKCECFNIHFPARGCCLEP
jgi:hypothetical protein